MMKRIAAYPVALLTGGALLLTACSAETNATEPAGLSVVATTTQLGDFTRSVVGEIPARVTQLADVNQSLHGFDPSAGDLVAIREADVIVVNGGGLDGWIEDAIEASGFDGVIVNTSEGIDMDVSPAGAADSHEGEAAEAEEHEATPGGEDAHAGESAEEHAAHAGESGDPHVWHNVNNAVSQVEAITAALAAAAPEQAAAIEANAAGYVDELQALNAWIHENVDKVPADERLLVTSHDAFGHLVDDLGITYVGAVIPSTNDSAEASAEQLDALIAQIKETGVKAVFAESSINSAAAETIADETGAKVYAGDQALYGDSLGTAGSPGETYLGSQAHNVGLVLESWGVTPSEFPATLGK
ncbi:metal ABC transporter substrate-binding protein [Paeniglutamicibacter sulfureus]|uniref:Zinc/manganese transport system substrate-binding protein/manganese/iron transport system substrate-binding protein n=1 Tax=Paeniglutamicibacter sulfureus TaxID=43666 RepID=A0ABU2BLG2_9MICC|nr:metal ABC transporter substrate-binding protein [Paeniglutamicibacter sulfureus]MDR7359485.1 zinc/manganese transport system substrate-binding protein/manganese/iron transport system substrate-binding protein [Paeniglutamicibacter sulfureus]